MNKTPPFNDLARQWVLVLLVICLTGCSGATRSHDLNQTLAAYANVIRWMEIANAMTYIAPDKREDAYPSELEQSRWEQFRVTGYRESPVQMISEFEALQMVEISLTNRHTMAEKVIRDRQVWTWYEDDMRWWLTSGLPQVPTNSR